MSESITYQERVTIGGVTTTHTRTKSAGSLKSISKAIPDSSTNLQVAYTLGFSACKFFKIVADQVLTVKTNSSSVPDATLVLVANEPYIWADGMLGAFLIADDITTLYVTNASGSAATLVIQSLEDPTVA